MSSIMVIKMKKEMWLLSTREEIKEGSSMEKEGIRKESLH